MPPPTSPAKLHGAALIAPTYHITVKGEDSAPSGLFSTQIHAIDNATEVPPARAHRSFSTALNDWKYENLEWNSDPNRGLNLRPRMKCEGEREEDREDKEHDTGQAGGASYGPYAADSKDGCWHNSS
ncbi:hypothetical protein ACET3X_004381 [Alternaria dauci]|uniref:Uncharacterized protein n=1 Tax=Alternaria dauci TaxID=48095 RepID=A0ABR3UMS1_9PLEO